MKSICKLKVCEAPSVKAAELLRLYEAGRRDFLGENLRGQNFKGKDLSGGDFSGADIRSANFTNATLIGANFTNAKAGGCHHQKLVKQLPIDQPVGE